MVGIVVLYIIVCIAVVLWSVGYLDEGGVGYPGHLHLVLVSLWGGNRDLPGRGAQPVLGPVHRLPWGGGGTGTDIITW